MNGSKFLNYTEEKTNEFEGVIWDSTATTFYISMLSISLVIGLLYCGFLVYKSRTNQTTLLSCIRNVVIALLCRTLFSLLVAAINHLGNNSNVHGNYTLLSLECIFLNLVLAYWCILTIYIHGKVRSKEIDLTLHYYVFPAVALFFALVWIFVMASESKWTDFLSVQQWIVQSIRLLLLIVQLGLVTDMGRLLIIKKNSLNNDCKSLLIKTLAVIGGLMLIFWLQFGFSTGAHNCSISFFYFWCFIDGIQLALLCPLFYLFEIWGGIYSYGDNFVLTTMKKYNSTTRTTSLNSKNSFDEILCNGGTNSPIFTIQSTSANNEIEKSKINDVILSSVVNSEKLHKTMSLYNRFNVLLKDRTTVFQNEKFYDCTNEDSIKPRRNSLITDVYSDKETALSYDAQTIFSKDTIKIHNNKFDGNKKKNAFYKSKYLIVDNEQNKLPRYLDYLDLEQRLLQPKTIQLRKLIHQHTEN